jgi:integrase/recombinase XerD
MEVQNAYEPFLIYCRTERSYAPESQQKIQDCFRSWILPVLGKHQLEYLSPLDVLNLRGAMEQRKLGSARQYSIIVTLKLLLAFCRKTLRINCLDPNEIRLPRRPHRKVDYLTEEELSRIFATINTRTIPGLRSRTLIEVLLATGMRISEALSLNRESINYETGEADIIGKGNKPRTVFFHEDCLWWVAQYLARRRDGCPALFATLRSNPKRWTRRDMPKLFQKLKAKAGIEKHLTPHLFRHTFCTHLLQNGADITHIKELAGHQDIQTTARYYLGVDKLSLKDVLKRCQPYRGAHYAPAS